MARYDINYKDNTYPTTRSSASQLEQLNHFFGYHEVEKTGTHAHCPAPNSRHLIIQTADGTFMLPNTKIWEAVGPDGVPGQVLRDCGAELL